MPPCVLLLNLTLTHTLPPYGYGIKCFVATPQSPTIHWLCLHCHSNQDTGDRLTAPHIKYHLNPIEVYLSMFLTYIKSNITVIYCKNWDRNAPYCLGSHRGGIIKPRCRLRLPDKGSEICRGGEKKRKKKAGKQGSECKTIPLLLKTHKRRCLTHYGYSWVRAPGRSRWGLTTVNTEVSLLYSSQSRVSEQPPPTPLPLGYHWNWARWNVHRLGPGPNQEICVIFSVKHGD